MRTKEDLEKLTDQELLEIHQSYWIIGRFDDQMWADAVAKNFNRENSIEFILDMEANEDYEN